LFIFFILVEKKIWLLGGGQKDVKKKRGGGGGGGGSALKALGMENPGGWCQTGKPSMGGMDIFWKHSLRVPNVLLYKVSFKREIKEN